jgi:hypothetical protein
MSTQYRLVQSGKTASGGCSAGQGSSEPGAPRIYLFIYFNFCMLKFYNCFDGVISAISNYDWEFFKDFCQNSNFISKVGKFCPYLFSLF